MTIRDLSQFCKTTCCKHNLHKKWSALISIRTHAFKGTVSTALSIRANL